MKPPDLLVVGAGSAGSAIAARASENPDLDVLLVEAGPDHPDPSALPADLRDGTRNSMEAHDWGYWHEPLPGQVPFAFPRGRVVGGSSAVNTCIALRGQPYDHDEWGLPEWSWERCLPAYRRLERDLDFEAPWHGSDGPLPIRRHTSAELAPWQSAFLEAASEMGFPACPDHNDPKGSGYGPHPMNKLNGERISAARAYLDAPTRARENLRILPGALVERVRFAGRRACGVDIRREGKTTPLEAAVVILCGGAINTPGLLLRSGVGPRADLARLGVDFVSDVPAVGAQLLDHPGTAIILLPRPGIARTRDPLIQTAVRFASHTEGRPNDLQLQAGSFLPLPSGDVPLVSLMTCVCKPRGRGRIVYESADPLTAPRLHSDFLRDPDDLELALEAVEMCWLLATSPAMKSLASLWLPGERALSSPASMRDWIRSQTGSGYHPCGTVPMGPRAGHGGAATDAYGRVAGTERLLVADASLFPTIPSANTNLATLMLGERFGAWLRNGSIAW